MTLQLKLLKSKIMNKVFLVTPNIPEAEVLSNVKIKNIKDMVSAANIISKMGVKNVLIKGDIENQNLWKMSYSIKQGIKIFKNIRFKTKNTHGTGCTLSSAITNLFIMWNLLKKSCELGIKYVNQAIGSNPNYGKGHGPINHLNSIL